MNEYGVIEDTDPDEFAGKIQEHLEEGWILHGQLVVTYLHSREEGEDILYTQAVTR